MPIFENKKVAQCECCGKVAILKEDGRVDIGGENCEYNQEEDLVFFKFDVQKVDHRSGSSKPREFIVCDECVEYDFGQIIKDRF